MCAASWRVDTRNCLIAVARRGHARSMTIVEARAAIRERNLQCFVTDERRFEREGIVATSEPMRLLDESGDEPALLGLGRMQLRADCLRVLDRFGSALLELPLAELATAEVELRRRLLFRTKDNHVYEAVLPHESPLKWAELVEHWRQRAVALTSQQAAPGCADERD